MVQRSLRYQDLYVRSMFANKFLSAIQMRHQIHLNTPLSCFMKIVLSFISSLLNLFFAAMDWSDW